MDSAVRPVVDVHRVSWDLSALTEPQTAIITEAIARTDFDWDRLSPGLQLIAGKDAVPVEFADLSRYGTEGFSETRGSQGSPDHSHPGDTPVLPELGHIHVHTDGDLAHGIVYRQRTLGLAWYSGKVSIDSALEHDPELAQEVFLAEGAHMVDFFLMELEPERRERILFAYHGGYAPHVVGHSNDWFEEEGELDYQDWVGESFMIGFTRAFSDLDIRFDQFSHASTPHVVTEIRAALAPPAPEPTPIPIPPAPEPEVPQDERPPRDRTTKKYGVPDSEIYHRKCCPAILFSTRKVALPKSELAFRRPCLICRPRQHSL